MTSRVLALFLGIAFLVCGPATAQQLTGDVSGNVQDAQGGLLPGVTVTASGPALIGGSQTTVTNAAGAYQIVGLPPGMYVLTYELAGFTTLQRDGVRVQVAQSTRVDAAMSVGSVEETITVSGETPLVDVRNTTTQTNIDKEFFDTIPTSRNPWTMAGLVPGVVTATLDVGGTEGMQQYNLQAYGSSSSQKSFSVDGVKMNWSGGDGGSANQYYSNEMFEEYNFQTASGTAESDASGVYMNMITKSGGNRFSGEYVGLFMNNATQGTNVDAHILSRLGLAPGASTGAAGNPIDIMYDLSVNQGGPLVRDKLWFFGSFRWFRLDQFQIGAVNADGSLGIDDNLARAGLLKGTYQINPSNKAAFTYIPHVRDRYHRRNAPFLAIPDKSTVHNILDTDSWVANYNRVVGRSMVVTASVGHVYGTWANLYQADVTDRDIVVDDTVRSERFNASPQEEINPNSRTQVNTNLSYFTKDVLGGSHDFKVGFARSWDVDDWDRHRNGDMTLQLRDGVAFQALLANSPVRALHRWDTWGAFVQDRYQLERFTFNVGVRFDGTKAYLPAQTSPAGLWVGERSFPRSDVFSFNFSAGPRLGVVYDVFGDGRTALKSYYGRFYDQFGAAIPEAVNPNNLKTVQVPWTDLNNNRMYDPGELNLSTFVGFPPGLSPRVLPDAKRPYSDEVSAGVDQQLPLDMAVSISYHRRMLRDVLTIVDRARPSSAYTAVERTYTDGGVSKSVTVYDLDRSLVTLRDRVITNADRIRSSYNGLDITVTKKMSNRWQVLTGATFSQNRGFNLSSPFTNPGDATDFNNPNYVLNRDDGAVYIDLPWTYKAAGSFLFPGDVLLAGKWNARAGDPLVKTLVVTGLNQGSETVNVDQRGVNRTETVADFIDLRVSKRFRVALWSFDAALDVYNITNANPVLSQNTAVGSTLGRPTTILAPRIVRLNFTAKF